MALRLAPTRSSSEASIAFQTISNPRRQTAYRALPPTSRRQFITEAITTSSSALQAAHDLSGLPWALSLPFFALLLRTTFILPLSIYQRRAAQKQVELQPLIQAWRYSLQKETMREYGHLGPSVAQQALLSKLRKKRAEIFKRHRCGYWKNSLSLAQLPVFLSVMEALRNMTGSHQGWFGMMFGGVQKAGVDDELGVITGDGLVADALRIPIDPSFSSEGMLWFPNLLIADPQLILPFVLSGTILLNVVGGGIRKQDLMSPRWNVRLKRGMGVAALCIGPIMLHVPSALLLFWISSSGLALIQAMILDRVMPIKPQPTPCVPKRPWKTGLGLPTKSLNAP